MPPNVVASPTTISYGAVFNIAASPTDDDALFSVYISGRIYRYQLSSTFTQPLISLKSLSGLPKVQKVSVALEPTRRIRSIITN